MKKQSLMILSLLGVLCACGGGSSEPSQPVDLNAYGLAEKIAKAASKYGNAITASELVASVSADLSSTEENKQIAANNRDLVLLLQSAFASRMPEHIGARKFQGYSNYSLLAINTDGFQTNDSGYAAIKWLNDRGLFTPDDGTFAASTVVTPETAKIWIDRFHTYIGTSAKDDFFAYANHDLLYDQCPDKGGPHDSISYSSLISQKNINDWAKSFYEEVPEAKAFESTYFDMDRRVKGDASGLAEAIRSLTDVETIGEFIGALKKMVEDTGYCPLWESTEYGKQSPVIGGTEHNVYCVTATSYSNTATSASIAPGEEDYKSSVTRFAPIFADVMGYTDIQAKQWATRYTDFKYQFALRREANKSLSKKLFVPEQGKIYGDENDGINLYQFLLDLGVNDPKWFLFADACDAQSLFDLFSQEHLPELQGLAVWQMLEHFTPCLPDGNAVMAWAHSGGGRHDEEGLASDSYYGNYVIPYVANNLANHYLATPEFDEDLETIHGLIADLRTAFSGRAKKASTTWGSVSVEAKVNTKLNNIVSYVGGADDEGNKHAYLDMDFASKEEGGTLYGNLAVFANAEFDAYTKNLGVNWSIDSRVAQLETMMAGYHPLYPNAFYAPWVNGIDITLGYMAAYKRAGAMSKEELLSSYGWVVGHEMSHGLDATGVYYDELGNYRVNGYFLEKDNEAYGEEAKKIARFYNKDEVMPGQMSNGFRIRDEAIADVTGLGMCVDIGKTISGFDFKKFFTLGAQNFGAYASQDVYVSYYAPDEHPWGRIRVNQAFKTCSAFYEAFDVKEGDGMWVAPEDRAVIWPE